MSNSKKDLENVIDVLLCCLNKLYEITWWN